jgi:Zn-dependent peptidase ImmA (M78 family)/DNA-binding XRE family transcriptional regulator
MQTHVLDAIDLRLIGERLAEARRARKLTQQDAADALGVARTTVTAMEKGERRPRASELVTLAGLYGRSIAELTRQAPDHPPPDFLVQFRATARGRERSADRADDIHRFEQLCRWYAELEEELGAPLPRRYPDEYDISGAPPEQAAEEVAAAERNRLGLGDAPIGDLWGLLETDIGLRVFALPMKDGRVSGMFVYNEAYGGCIAINANHPEERRRWNAAHELGHFLAQRYSPEITVFASSARLPESERFADAFARFFLMPTVSLRRRFEAIRRAKEKPVTPADVLSLSQLYGVSFQAMTLRLEDLRLINPGTWDRLHDLGFRPNEARSILGLAPAEPELPNLPHRYVALAVQAFREDLLSEGQLTERLGTDRLGAREIVEAATNVTEPGADGEWRQVTLDLATALVGNS